LLLAKTFHGPPAVSLFCEVSAPLDFRQFVVISHWLPFFHSPFLRNHGWGFVPAPHTYFLVLWLFPPPPILGPHVSFTPPLVNKTPPHSPLKKPIHCQKLQLHPKLFPLSSLDHGKASQPLLVGLFYPSVRVHTITLIRFFTNLLSTALVRIRPVTSTNQREVPPQTLIQTISLLVEKR